MFQENIVYRQRCMKNEVNQMKFLLHQSLREEVTAPKKKKGTDGYSPLSI